MCLERADKVKKIADSLPPLDVMGPAEGDVLVLLGRNLR